LFNRVASAQYPFRGFLVRRYQIAALVPENVLVNRLARVLQPQATGIAAYLIGNEDLPVPSLSKLELKVGKQQPSPI
jgi:hypothetical protein